MFVEARAFLSCTYLLNGKKPLSIKILKLLLLEIKCGSSLLELPYVEMLALTGKAVEGDVLTAVEVIPNSETQQHVWSKYKKDIRYQWYGGIIYIAVC